MFRSLIFMLAVLLCGCSVHPIPDDVSRYYSTVDIVRNVRCEAKMAVRERIDRALDRYPELRAITPDLIFDPDNLEKIHRRSPQLAATFQNYKDSSIAYQFKFEITENDHAVGSLDFFMPWSSGSLSAGADASVRKTRYGLREYDSSETFGELAKLRCDNFQQARRNIIYPLTGSIGVRRIMNTFIDLSEMGSGQEAFTDTITFLTVKRADLDANVVALRAVPHQFRIVTGSADLGISRRDMHQLIVTLKFPTRDLRVARVDSFERRAASYVEESERSRLQAIENLCIARAEQREDRLGTVRLFPPEIYCRQPEAVANEVVLPRSAVSVRAREERAASVARAARAAGDPKDAKGRKADVAPRAAAKEAQPAATDGKAETQPSDATKTGGSGDEGSDKPASP